MLLCNSITAWNAVIVKPSISKAEESEVNITLLGTADIHGRFMPWDYALDGANMSGSLTQLYTVIKKIVKKIQIPY